MKKILSLLLAFALVLSFFTIANAEPMRKDPKAVVKKSGPVRSATTDALFEDFTEVDKGKLPKTVIPGATNVYTEQYEVLPGYTKNCLVLDDISFDKRYSGVDATINFPAQKGITEITVRYKYLKPDECTHCSFVIGLNSGKGLISRVAVASSDGRTRFNYGYEDEALMEGVIINHDAWYTLTYIIDFNPENEGAHIDATLWNETTGNRNVLLQRGYCDSSVSHKNINSVALQTSMYGGKYVIDYVRVRSVKTTLANSGKDPYADIIKGVPQKKIPIPVSHPVKNKLNITLNGVYKYTSKKPYVAHGGSVMITAKNFAEIFNLGYSRKNGEHIITSGGTKIVLGENEGAISVNGAEVSLNDATIVSGNQLYVPLDALCRAIGADMSYDVNTNTALITKGGNN